LFSPVHCFSREISDGAENGEKVIDEWDCGDSQYGVLLDPQESDLGSIGDSTYASAEKPNFFLLLDATYRRNLSSKVLAWRSLFHRVTFNFKPRREDRTLADRAVTLSGTAMSA
jgi:hypothetical protein